MNQKVTVNITGLTHQGEGVGRLPDGLAVFVPGTIPGEQAVIQVEQRKKNFARARLVQIVKQTDERCRPQCGAFADCGGCGLQHINYTAQLKYKTRLVEDNLRRIGKLTDIKVQPTLGMANPKHYRNKVHFQLQEVDGRIALGYYRQGSHQFLPLTEPCLLVDQALNETAKTIERLLNTYPAPVYNWQTKRGLLRHVVLRKGLAGGEIMAVIVTAGGKWAEEKQFAAALQKAQPQVVSVVRNINKAKGRVVMGEENITLAGKPTITDWLGDLRFEISPNSFYQVNPRQTLVLYRKAAEYAGLTGKESVIDAYCGIGTIALFIARHAREVIGLEVVPQAVEDARKNARHNGISNAEFYQGEVERLLPLLQQEGYRPDVVILDPPRKGCDEQSLAALAKMAVPRIVYVSCDPGTLSRDLAYLTSNGFSVKEVQPVDMFPYTSHVECCALLIKK